MLLGWGTIAEAGNEIWVEDAEIEGVPAKLQVDTASALDWLYRDRAGQFVPAKWVTWGLAGNKRFGWSTCQLRFAGRDERAPFWVLDYPRPSYSTNDGFIGWASLRRRIFSIDVDGQKLGFLEKLPETTGDWIKLPIEARANLLTVNLPGNTGRLVIDTGDFCGVELEPKRWAEWKANNPKAARSMVSSTDSFQRVSVAEEDWAGQIEIGPLAFNEVPVTPLSSRLDKTLHCIAKLGREALERFEIIVDGPGESVYFRPKRAPIPPYSHDTGGLAFVRDDLINRFVAHVAEGTPAWEAGVRDGDVLLRYDSGKYSDAAAIGTSIICFRDKPPGATVALVLERNTLPIPVKFTTRKLLGPGVEANEQEGDRAGKASDEIPESPEDADPAAFGPMIDPGNGNEE